MFLPYETVTAFVHWFPLAILTLNVEIRIQHASRTIFGILSPSNSQVTKTDVLNIVLKIPKNHIFGHISALICGLMTKISQKMRNQAAIRHVNYLGNTK